MSISERDRHHLHSKAAEAMGDEAAETLMSYLPPVGWADVAVKRDLDALEERTNLRFERVEDRLGRVEDRLGRVEERLGRVEGGLGRVEGGLELLSERFRHMEGRVDSLDQVFVTKAEMTGHVRTILMGTAALNVSIGTLVVGALAVFA